MKKIYKIDKNMILESFGLDTIKNADLNITRDKIMKNGGLITGGLLAGGGMFAHMLNNPENDIGADIIGASVLGTAGAGVGHVIHKQLKKKDEFTTPEFNQSKF